MAVISQRLWLSRLEGVDSALGRRIAVNGHSFVVVGVAERFRGWGRLTRVGETDVWLPFGSQRRVTGQSVMSDPVGRIAAGSSAETVARASPGGICGSLSSTARPLWDVPTHCECRLVSELPKRRDSDAPLLAVDGTRRASALASWRQCHRSLAGTGQSPRPGERRSNRTGREPRATAAQGSRRSFGLAVFAWVLGVLVAVFIVAALQGMRLVETFPDFGDIRFDVAVLLFGAAVTGMIVLAAGALPAILTTGRDVRELLSRSGRTATPRLLLRQGFLIAQIALSLVLLVGSAVLNRSVEQNLLDTSLGMDVRQHHRIGTATGMTSATTGLGRRTCWLPWLRVCGPQILRDVAVSYGNPLTSSGPIALRTSSMTEPRQTSVLLTSVSPDYFHVLGIPVLARPLAHAGRVPRRCGIRRANACDLE